MFQPPVKNGKVFCRNPRRVHVLLREMRYPLGQPRFPCQKILNPRPSITINILLQTIKQPPEAINRAIHVQLRTGRKTTQKRFLQPWPELQRLLSLISAIAFPNLRVLRTILWNPKLAQTAGPPGDERRVPEDQLPSLWDEKGA